MSSDDEGPASASAMTRPDISREDEGCCIFLIAVSIIIAIIGIGSPFNPSDPNSSVATSLTFALAAVSFSLLYIGIQIRKASLRES